MKNLQYLTNEERKKKKDTLKEQSFVVLFRLTARAKMDKKVKVMESNRRNIRATIGLLTFTIDKKKYI
jgi:hypothetical protein